MPDARAFLTSEVLRLLREANPERSITEDQIRGVIRRGKVAAPRVLSGCYFWTLDQTRELAAALRLKLPTQALRQ